MSKIGMFRAQITKTKEWVEGFYTQKKTGKFTHGSYQERFADCIITYFSDGGINAQEIDPTTLEYLGEQDGCEWCNSTGIYYDDLETPCNFCPNCGKRLKGD